MPSPDPARWKPRPRYPRRVLVAATAALVLLSVSARRTQMDQAVGLVVEWAASLVGLRDSSQIGRGAARFIRDVFPLRVSEETPLNRIEGFDPAHLPWLARVETRETVDYRLDPQTLQTRAVLERQQVLVQPLGYFIHVLLKMLESLEIALWGTILAIVLAAPLVVLGARNFTPHWALHPLARAIGSFLRAVPELVSALFLVLAFGFGSIAGVVALGLHCAGFFAKFFADDIENADRGPQEALAAVGASRLKVLRFAVLPQVLPQYLAYVQYVLERNVRMATVIGIVGAGGIGQELKGRFEMFHYGHVGTILVVIFGTVLLLELFTSRVRGSLM